jgi:hypothetical protein
MALTGIGATAVPAVAHDGDGGRVVLVCHRLHHGQHWWRWQHHHRAFIVWRHHHKYICYVVRFHDNNGDSRWRSWDSGNQYDWQWRNQTDGQFSWSQSDPRWWSGGSVH